MDEGKAGGRPVDDVIDGAGQEALYGRCAAVERNVLHVEAGLAVEEIAGQPRGDNPRAIVELAGIRLGARNQLLHGLGPSSVRTLKSDVFLDASVIGAKSLSGS